MNDREFYELMMNRYGMAAQPLLADDLLKELSREVPMREDLLCERMLEWLYDSNLFYEDQNREDVPFVPYRSIFQGAVFRVTPTESEIREGILIPGHRFVPFLPYDCPGSAASIQINGREVNRLTVEKTMEELQVFHSLIGMHDRIMLFLNEHEENEKRMQALRRDPEGGAGIKLKVQVFDLKDFYVSHRFQPGDSLVLTVEDWLEARYTARYSPASELTEAFTRCRAWCDLLENSLMETFEELGPLTDVYSQLVEAFCLGGQSLLEFAGLHIGGFLAQSESIAITSLSNGDVILWRKGEEPDEDFGSMVGEARAGKMMGRTDSLDAILADMGLSVSGAEVEAIMRDELFGGREAVGEVIGRVFDGLKQVTFASEEQSQAFFKQVEDLWEKTTRNYNRFADAQAGELRRRVLELHEKQTLWMRSLDERGVQPDELPGSEMFMHGQISAMFYQCLAFLNDPESYDSDEFQDIQANIDGIGERMAELIGIVETALESQPSLTLLDNQNESSPRTKPTGEVYQMKITLDYTKPPIWRRVLLPSSYFLEELHVVIQNLFDWQDCHMHCFRCNGVEYGDDASMAGEECEPEEGVRLSELELDVGSKFQYVYDFGDDWQHTILLEKVLPYDKNEMYPVCTAARRAAPPEDCGGVPGYYMMLEALEDPEHPQHGEFMEWLGGNLDPSRVDIKEINNIFKEWNE
jgi:hypothetical protein